MSTYNELVSMVNDELKNLSDDSFFNEEHILFTIDKVRSFLLKQRYSDIRKEIPESNYQTICINLEEVNNDLGTCSKGHYLKSVEKIPYMMSISPRNVTPYDYFQGNINYINSSRFKYAGHNKLIKNQIYTTIAPDGYLYLKSNNPKAYYLEKVKVTGIFEDSLQALELRCKGENDVDTCDDIEQRFPIEESLITPLIELVVKELSAFKYQAQDTTNNANDDFSNLAQFMRAQLAEGRKSDLYKNL